MAQQPVVIADNGGVRRITLSRQDVANAFDVELHDELIAVLRQTARSADVRAVLLTGAGSAFSAGGDLDHISAVRADRALRKAEMRRAEEFFDTLVSLPQPVVGFINGPAVGLGCTTALLCDLLVMSDTATLIDPHVPLGVVAGDGAAAVLPLCIGLYRTRWHLLLGEPITAERASQLGIAVFTGSYLEAAARADDIATRLAAMPVEAVQATKRLINEHLSAHPRQVLASGLSAEELSFDSPELGTALQRMRTDATGRLPK